LNVAGPPAAARNIATPGGADSSKIQDAPNFLTQSPAKAARHGGSGLGNGGEVQGLRRRGPAWPGRARAGSRFALQGGGPVRRRARVRTCKAGSLAATDPIEYGVVYDVSIGGVVVKDLRKDYAYWLRVVP
jgi:hypothetical protein